MDGWEFDMKERVEIGGDRGTNGSEFGTVIGRAEYADADRAYYVAYHDGAGCYKKDWFNAADLSSAA